MNEIDKSVDIGFLRILDVIKKVKPQRVALKF